MSQAFVREQEEPWLSEVAPTVTALSLYLTRQNNGHRVYEQNTELMPDGRIMHMMSDGMCYVKDQNNRWQMM